MNAHIVSRMEQVQERQRQTLCEYSANRHYKITTEGQPTSAVMDVHLTYQRGKGKHFEILKMQDASLINRRAFLSLIKEETEASTTDGDAHRLDSANYDFESEGTASLDGETCLLLKLKPKRRSKYLVDGEAWLDTKSYTVLKITGDLADKPSFWIHRPAIVQLFKQWGQFSFPSYNSSEAKVTFLGQTRLTIEYSGYQSKACTQP